jgi:ribonuclease T1
MRSRTALALLALVAIFAVVQLVSHSDNGSNDSGSSASPTTASQPGTPSGGAEEVPVDGAAVTPEEHAAIAGVLELIDAGGPYPNRADGEVFENREQHLPQEPRGYYHSYTVPTPGSADRGARRIITGRGGELFYTSDHYDSFDSIDAADYQ